MNDKENNDVNNDELTLNENSGELSLDDIKRMVGETFRDMAFLLPYPFDEYKIYIYRLVTTDKGASLSDLKERALKVLNEYCIKGYEWIAQNDRAILLRMDVINNSEFMLGFYGSYFVQVHHPRFISEPRRIEKIICKSFVFYRVKQWNPKPIAFEMYTLETLYAFVDKMLKFPTINVQLKDNYWRCRLLNMIKTERKAMEEIKRLKDELEQLRTEHEATQEELKQTYIKNDTLQATVGVALDKIVEAMPTEEKPAEQPVEEEPDEKQPMTQEERDAKIKETLTELLEDKKLFKYQNLWYAVFRVFHEYMNYSNNMKDFVRDMERLGMNNGANKKVDYDSISDYNQKTAMANKEVKKWSEIRKDRYYRTDPVQIKIAERLLELLRNNGLL